MRALLFAVSLAVSGVPVAAPDDTGCTAAKCHVDLAVTATPEAPDPSLHGELGEGRCSPCHPEHETDKPPPSLLHGSVPAGPYTTYTRAGYEGCYGECHKPELVEKARTTTSTRFRNGDDNLHFRHVAKQTKGRSCSLCHSTHQATGAGLIRDDMPFGNEILTLEFSTSEDGGSCVTSCHITTEYNRRNAVPSPMRVETGPSGMELP